MYFPKTKGQKTKVLIYNFLWDTLVESYYFRAAATCGVSGGKICLDRGVEGGGGGGGRFGILRYIKNILQKDSYKKYLTQK